MSVDDASMHVPLIDLRRQHDALSDEYRQAIERVIASGGFILGEENKRLEEEIAALCETSYGIAVNSGTDALILALEVSGVKPGDEVITTPYTFFATVEAILRVGAVPVLVDIEPSTYNINAALVERSITPKTKAVIPVHLFGLPADMRAIQAIAKKHGLIVIEDACQAIGAKYREKRVGSWGDLGCFSFYPTKNLGGCGDGGMIVTETAAFAEQLRLLRSHGSDRKYHHKAIGYNTRLDEFQAAILLAKLNKLAVWNKRRQQLASRYTAAFAGLPVQTPVVPDKSEHVFHLYILRTENAKDLELYLKAQGIGCGIYYPLPLHKQTALQGRCRYHALPVAESVAGTTIALPVYPELTDAEQDRVIELVTRFFKESPGEPTP
jgi:dTDP-4-amino-4,6-dideoxygalactose transaminase